MSKDCDCPACHYEDEIIWGSNDDPEAVYVDISCDQCQVLTINGIPCHETGCINSWINPVTGKGYAKECRECGCDYIPKHKVSRFGICPDCKDAIENPETLTEEDDE